MHRQFFTKGEGPASLLEKISLTHPAVHEIDVPDDCYRGCRPASDFMSCSGDRTQGNRTSPRHDVLGGEPLFALPMWQIQLVGDLKCGK